MADNICDVVRGFLRNSEAPMAEDSRSTSAGRLKGSVKEAIGKLTGDVRIEAEGQRQKRRARRAEAAGAAESGSGTGGPERR